MFPGSSLVHKDLQTHRPKIAGIMRYRVTVWPVPPSMNWALARLTIQAQGVAWAVWSLQVCQPSVVFRLSTDWMKSIHIMEDKLFYSKSTDININLIPKNNCMETSRIMLDEISGHCNPAKWLHWSTTTLLMPFICALTGDEVMLRSWWVILVTWPLDVLWPGIQCLPEPSDKQGIAFPMQNTCQQERPYPPNLEISMYFSY